MANVKLRVRQNHNWGGEKAGALVFVSEEEAALHPDVFEQATTPTIGPLSAVVGIPASVARTFGLPGAPAEEGIVRYEATLWTDGMTTRQALESAVNPPAAEQPTVAQATGEPETIVKIRATIGAPPDEYPDILRAVEMLHGDWSTRGAMLAREQEEGESLKRALGVAQQETDRLRTDNGKLTSEAEKLRQDLAEARRQLEAPPTQSRAQGKGGR